MKVKSCVFCNRVNGLEICGCATILGDRDVSGYAIYCNNCGARGPVKDTERKAVNAWNKRPKEDELGQLAETIAQHPTVFTFESKE